MQVSSLATDVRSANLGATTGFKMETNEFAFRVLSDGLYQNKIGSMVREVSCNALDSHAEAGYPERPITLHMPDTFEPWFSVRDTGIGLDDEGVRATFATYFRSTKRNSNTPIGAFGLGSKTPFAYTDAFQITAVKDGKLRNYSAFINSVGVPDIANMGGEFTGEYVLNAGEYSEETVIDQWNETDLPNGVTITVPVTKSDDFNRFRNEVKNQLTFFPVKPEIQNITDEIQWMDWSGVGSYMNLDRILVGDERSNSTFYGLWVVQGPVGYKADMNLLKQHLSADNVEFLDIFSRCAILRFNLGEIEVTPSREGLSYSPRTIAAIETLLLESRVTIKDKVKEQIDALGDNWATALALNENNTLRRLAVLTGCKWEAEGYYNTSTGYFIDLVHMANLAGLVKPEAEPESEIKALGFDHPWNGVSEDDDADVEVDNENDEDEEDEEADDATTQFIARFNLRFVTYVRRSEGRRRTKTKWVADKDGRSAKVGRDFIVLAIDTKEKVTARIREFTSGVGYKTQLFTLENRDGTPVTDAQLDAVKARIGASWKYSRLSKVELPVRERSSYDRTGYKCPKGYIYPRHASMNETCNWIRSTDNLKLVNDGAYYVIVHRQRTDSERKDSIVFGLADSGLLDKPIMAIREKDADKLVGNPAWIPVSTKAQEIIDAVEANVSLHNAYRFSQCSLPSYDGVDINVLRSLFASADEIAKDSPLHKLFRMMKSLNAFKLRGQNRGYNSIIDRVIPFLSVSLDETEMETAIAKRAAKLSVPVTDTYPLLAFLRSSRENGYASPTDKLPHIISYINSRHAGA